MSEFEVTYTVSTTYRLSVEAESELAARSETIELYVRGLANPNEDTDVIEIIDGTWDIDFVSTTGP
jgi:hypothetical protein